MLDILSKYISVEEAMTPTGLVKLRTAYESLVKDLSAEKETAETEGDSLLKVTKETVEKNEAVVLVLKTVAEQIRSLLNEVIDTHPEASFLLVDTVQTIKSEVMMERDYQLSKIQRDQKPVKVVADKSFTERKDEAEKLSEAIRAIFSILSSTMKAKKKGEGFVIKIGDVDFPVKETKKDGKGTGEFLPDLSRLPRTPGESTAIVGRSATVRRLRFSWNGEELPPNTLVNDVAHDYVSDWKSGLVVDWRAIKSAVEATGQKMFDTEPWTVEFPTGVLVGWLPPKEDELSE